MDGERVANARAAQGLPAVGGGGGGAGGTTATTRPGTAGSTTTREVVVGRETLGDAGSVVSQWVDELTVRGESTRVPTEGEVAT